MKVLVVVGNFTIAVFLGSTCAPALCAMLAVGLYSRIRGTTENMRGMFAGVLFYWCVNIHDTRRYITLLREGSKSEPLKSS